MLSTIRPLAVKAGLAAQEFDMISDEMKALKRWVLWKDVNGSKIPRQVAQDAPASSTNEEHWSTYAEASEALRSDSGASGVGFVFKSGDGFIGVDFDDCLDCPEKKAVIDELIENLDSYAEVSPSGNGVKVFGKGSCIGKGRRFNWHGVDMELYSNARFFTVTERVYSEDRPVNDIEDVVDAVLHEANQEYRQTAPESPSDDACGPRPYDWESQVRTYLDGCKPATEGSGGDLQTFKVACRLATKFDLTKSETLMFLEEYNSRCDPPWDFHELEHKASRAMIEKVGAENVGDGYNNPVPIVTEIPVIEDRSCGIPASLFEVPWFMQAIMDTITDANSKDSKGLSLVGAITLMSHAIGRRYTEESGVFSNLYIVGLAPSSGGKQAVLEMLKFYFDRTNHADSLIGRVTSDSAIAKRLAKDPASLAIWDEFGLFLQKTNKGTSHTNSVQEVLLELWGATKNLWRAKSYADLDFDIQVVRPCFSFLGMTTPDHFWSGLTKMHLRDGFAGRLLVIDTGKRAERKEPVFDEEKMDKIARNVSALMEFHRNDTKTINGKEFPVPYVVPTDDDAKGEYESFLAYTDQFVDEVELGSIWGRAIEKVKKLALIYAVSANPECPLIDANAARWAIDFVLWSTNTFVAGTKREILSDGSLTAEITREVIATMKDHGHATVTTLVKSLMKPTSKIREVVEMLEVAGMVQKVKVKQGNRTKEVYCLK